MHALLGKSLMLAKWYGDLKQRSYVMHVNVVYLTPKDPTKIGYLKISDLVGKPHEQAHLKVKIWKTCSRLCEGDGYERHSWLEIRTQGCYGTSLEDQPLVLLQWVTWKVAPLELSEVIVLQEVSSLTLSIKFTKMTFLFDLCLN